MITHLGMTGKFFIVNKEQVYKKTSFYYNVDSEKDKKHNHIIFYFKNGLKLIYNDVRKFGFIKFSFINKSDLNILPSLTIRAFLINISDIIICLSG